MSEGKQQTRAGRRVIVVLLIIIVILLASLGYTLSTVGANNSLISSLKDENQKLNSQISQLQDRISSLQSDNQNLMNRISSLQSENQNLRNQVNQLQNQIADLTAIVNLQRQTILERDKTVNLQAGGSINLQYSTPYAGYISVSFTASGPVFFSIGSSFMGTYYFRYPADGTATSGSFMAPVLPGTTYLYIEHPAFLIGATVTFTVTYVY